MTEFDGNFKLTPNLSMEQIALILQINTPQINTPQIKEQLREPPPPSWCHWIPNEYGTHLTWDGAELFYDHVEWLEYLIEYYFKPWKLVLSGAIDWQGDDPDDRGCIHAKDNKIESVRDKIYNPGPSWNRTPTIDVAGGTVFSPRKNT